MLDDFNIVLIMSFKFEKLTIWQDSMDFGEKIFKISINFPKEETFNLTSQIRRASDSIALNISEEVFYKVILNLKSFLDIRFVHWQKW